VGVDALDPTTGAPSARYDVSPPAPGSSVYPHGSGFVVARAGAPTVVYR
jgi:hypothetical protein